MDIFNIHLELKFLPAYIFMAFLVGFLLYEIIKFIIFVIKMSIIKSIEKDQKDEKNKKDKKGFYNDSKKYSW